MLTAWAKQAASVQKSTTVLPSISSSSTDVALIEAKTIAGNTRYIPPVPTTNATFALLNAALVETGTNASAGVAIGSDGSSESENSYNLGNIITGNISAPTPTIESAYDVVNGRYVARLDFTISNNTGDTITIREICLFVKFNTATSKGDSAATGNSRKSFMLDRTVLSTPVVIANNDAGIVRYEFAY